MIFSFLLLFALSPIGQAAQDFNLDSMGFSDVSSIKADAPAVPTPVGFRVPSAPSSPKKWTVMLYMNGKNNVEPFALRDMNRLETAGSSGEVNVVVELGRSGQAGDGDATWKGVRRYLVAKDADTSKISSPVVMEVPKADMGDWREAAGFVRWAKTNYPAQRTLLIIWDHGWGWIDPKKETKSGGFSTASISHDFDTGNYIRTEDLPNVFKGGGKVNVYASMACFMQMAEVAWEVKDYADVIVGSEEMIQAPSFNFEDFLAALERDPGAGAEQAGVFLVDTFKDMYSRPDIAAGLAQSKYGVQLSAIRSRELPGLVQRLDQWAAVVKAVDDRKAVLAAKQGVLRMEVGDETTDPMKRISFYGDLSNFVELLDKSVTDRASEAIKSRGAAVTAFIADRLVIRNVFVGKDRTGKDYSNAHGLSIEIPGEPGNLVDYVNKYSDLPFAKASSWASFVTYLDSVKAEQPAKTASLAGSPQL
ncbi:MAG: clostripain-related cysteine peptidase [Elusimicrobia bacterium]|nr:clostripain-related cysteine peptidase [Elusimicrobiota bacterium]